MRSPLRFKFMLAHALMLLLVMTAGAQTRSEVKKTVEASLLVTGDIIVTEAGKVEGFTLDTPDKLPKEVVNLIDTSLPGWQFEPVIRDGAAVKAKSRMSLRLVANKREDGNYLLAIRSAAFTGDSDLEVEKTWLVRQRLDPPRYPANAAQARVSGTVYVIVKVGRDGRVEDAFAEQTNLRYLGSANEMARWRKVLELPALQAARNWQFTVPANGDAAKESHWTARVPVDYSFSATPLTYGTWSPYVPGPRALAPWVKPEFARAQDIDAGQNGTPAPVGTGIRLKTDLSQG